ncbi:uncharacterized protein LOC119736608 [Patiria miniata]|uniref:DUF4708 domain-containing protein n=1 Tax=Patiria miniata TaxID=46514 RepID=A0A914AS00_PATMI|nr:uncharacterized protein LOC119736608 [Patiria miniata]
MASKSSASSIFFASTPNFKDLCSVTLQVQENTEGGMTPSKYVGSQPQIVKCRQLIFTEPGVLASPSLQQEGYIYAVLQQSVWKSGRLQARCQKMGLVVNKPMRVISPVFQACLAYTIRARMAPLWNKAGNWYIQGRDFLLNSGRVAAVDLELNVTEAEICLVLRPLMVKLPQSSLIDFEVCQPILDQFFLSANNVISEYSIDNKWCYVLPSLKKGKVVSISHEIPSTSPFKTYKEIRRYWKNAYGYRLPETDVGVLYYNVYFPAIGPTLFTYPEFCIRKDEPILQARIDPAPILNAFLTDLQYKVSSVCGTAFEVTPKAQYINTGLFPTGKEEAKLSQLNLSSTPPPTSVRRIPSRPISLQGCPAPNSFTPTPSLSQHTPTPSYRSPTYPLSGTVGDFNASFSIAGRVSIPAATNRVAQTPQTDGQYAAHTGYTYPGPVYNNVNIFSVSTALSPPARQTSFRPVLPKQALNNFSFSAANMWNDTAYSNPVVNKTTYSSIQSTNQCIPVATMMGSNQSNMQMHQRIIPKFVPQRSRTSHNIPASSTSSRYDDLSPRIVPSFHPSRQVNQHPKTQVRPSTFTASLQCTSLGAAGLSTPPQKPQNSHPDRPKPTKPSFAPSFPRKDSSQAAKAPAVKKKVQQTLDGIVVKAPKRAELQKQDCGKTAKRKSKDDNGNGPPASKKARSKPKVQEEVNVQSLAINDQLSKVNTVTLATWLKNKGIPVKAKEKKSDLMQKVANFIHANSIED